MLSKTRSKISFDYQRLAQKAAREGDLKNVEKLVHQHPLNHEKIAIEAITGGHFVNPVLAFCFFRKATSLQFLEDFMVHLKKFINTYHSKLDYSLDKIIYILRKDSLKNLSDFEISVWYENRNLLREFVKNAKVVMEKKNKLQSTLPNMIAQFTEIKILNHAEQFAKKIIFYYEYLQLLEDDTLKNISNNKNNYSLSHEIKNQIKNYHTFSN